MRALQCASGCRALDSDQQPCRRHGAPLVLHRHRSLQLRPPTMLARTAASLSVITEDRIQLGLGGGAFTEAIASMGGLPRHGDQMVAFTEESLGIMRRDRRHGTAAEPSSLGDRLPRRSSAAQARRALARRPEAQDADGAGPGRPTDASPPAEHLRPAARGAFPSGDHRRGGCRCRTHPAVNPPHLQRHRGHRIGPGQPGPRR